MSQANAAQPPPQQIRGGPQAALQHEIESCRRRLVLQTLARRLVVLLALAAVPPLLFVVADHSQPAGVPRSVTLVVGQYWRWLLGLGCLVLLVATFRRRLNPLFAARVLERTSGIDHNSVVNAVLLQRKPGAAYASAAAAEQATADLSEHWPPRVSESGALRAPSALAAVVLLAWIGYGVIATKPVWPSVARFFGARRPAPTATTLEQVQPRPGDAVHAGESLALEFAVRGAPVRQVIFEVFDNNASPADQPARYELRPARERDTSWQLTLAPHEVNRDIHYRCAANDAVLTGTIPVLPLPMLVGLEIELEPPTYSGVPLHTVSNPDLEVLAGTRATFRAFANTRVENATFVLVNGRETRMRMDVDPDNPRRFGVSLLLVEGGQYRIEFRDSLGAAVRDPPAYRITLRLDSGPSVEIIEPAEGDMPEGVIDVALQPALAAVAEDDLRVEEFELVRADAGVLARTRLKMELEPDGRRGRVRIPTSDLPLKPGQQMRAWFEVRDNRVLLDGTPAPQTARSRELILAKPATAARSRPDATESQPAPEQTAPPQQQQAEQKPEPSPKDNEPPPDGGCCDKKGDRAGATGGASDKDGFTENLKRFVEENGGMARDVGRRIPKPDEAPGELPGSKPPEAPPGESTPSGQAGEAPQSADAPVPEQDGRSEQPPPASRSEPAPAPQSQPQSQPCDSADKSETCSGGENQSKPDEGRGGSDSAPEAAQSTPKTGADKPERAGDVAQAESQAEADAAGQPREQRADEAQPPTGSEPAGDGTGDQRTDPPPESRPAALPQAPQQPNWRERAEPLRTEGLVETLDLLEWLDRGGAVDEKLLIELGWPADKAAGFVKALEKLHEQARQAGALGELRLLRLRLALGNADVQQGGGLSSAAQTTVDQARPHKDELRRIAPPPEQEVPAELRPLLDAYYRALSQRQSAAER